MTGDDTDFVARLRLTLPTGWFADDAPLLGGLFRGMAAAWSGLFAMLREVRRQSRLQTVGGQFLELACTDFFGLPLRRRGSEGDDALRARLFRTMRRERGTRAGLIAAAAEAGYAARVFEPARPLDTGVWNGSSGLAWGRAGGWGSLTMPLECLVVVRAVAPVAPIGAALAEAVPAGGAAWMRQDG